MYPSRRAVAVVLALVTGAVMGALAGLLVPPRLTAKALIVVGQAPTPTGGIMPLENPGLLAERLVSAGFVGKTLEVLRAQGVTPDDDAVSALVRSMTAKVVPNTPLVLLSVSASDSKLALGWNEAALRTLVDEHRRLMDPAVARVRADADTARAGYQQQRRVADQLLSRDPRGGRSTVSTLDIQQTQLMAMIVSDLRFYSERLTLLETSLDPRNAFLTRLAEPVTIDTHRTQPWWIAFALAGATLGFALTLIAFMVWPAQASRPGRE